jgi:hypothetical protein
MSAPTSANIRPPFIIGVTGNTDPADYHDDPEQEGQACKQLRQQIAQVFRWIRANGEPPDERQDNPARWWLNPKERKLEFSVVPADMEIWKGLNLQYTPIVVLTSLAPGVDTLVAEVALELNKEPNFNICVRAPLPFPEQIYAYASTFLDQPAKVKRYKSLLQRLRAQGPAFDAERDIFAVALDNDLESEPWADLYSKRKRNIRYRAAGEYVATHSDLLLAIYDDDFDPPGTPEEITSAGTSTIVETKRRGLTYELLAQANNFSWADNGPVLRISILRNKHFKDARDNGKPVPIDPKHPLKFLHPYDTRPEDGSDWDASGDSLFRRVLEFQEDFNSQPFSEERENAALEGILTTPTETDPKKKSRFFDGTNPEAERYALRLDFIARIRRRAADLSNKLGSTRLELLVLLLLLIATAATALGAYEHWMPDPAHTQANSNTVVMKQHGSILPDNGHDWFQLGLLAVGISLLVLIALEYHRYTNSKAEQQRYDYRAIGEGLRVQFFWHLCGLGSSVSADYMQRQRGELDWIRYIISSISFPFAERWPHLFKALPKPSRARLLDTTRRAWVVEQKEYFRKQGKKRADQAHHWHTWAWAAIAAALFHIFGHFIAELLQPVEDYLHHHPLHIVVALLILGYISEGFEWYQSVHHKAHLTPPQTIKERWASIRKEPVWSRLWSNPLLAPAALVFVGIRCSLTPSHHIAIPKSSPRKKLSLYAWLTSTAHWTLYKRAFIIAAGTMLVTWFLGGLGDPWPGFHGAWIIATSTTLLGGGLCLAWAERNVFAEEERSFRAMLNLYNCADARLEKLIPSYAAASDPAAEERLLSEIHSIYYQLGCEALNENAEWIILHRARPLEPFIGG